MLICALVSKMCLFMILISVSSEQDQIQIYFQCFSIPKHDQIQLDTERLLFC